MRRTSSILALLGAVVFSVGATVAQTTLTATLAGGTGGDQDGTGYAVVTFTGTKVDYSILVQNIASPTAAYVRRAADDSLALDLQVAFIGNLATGSLTASASTVTAVLGNPAAYYVTVVNAEFPAGAIRGALMATSEQTIVIIPVIATLKGQAGSNFKSDLVLGNQASTPIDVVAEWYPTGQTLTGPARTATLTVPAAGQRFTSEAPATLFQASETRGGLILRSFSPFSAQVRTYNDQRAAGQGTFGQFVDGLPEAKAMTTGVMYGLSQGGPFRTNIGWFNPTGSSVNVTFAAHAADGTKLGEVSATVPPFGNDIRAVFSLITGVANTTQPDFFVTYQASAAIFVFATVNDNTTNDGIHVAAKPLS